MLDYTFGTWLWIFEIQILKKKRKFWNFHKTENFGNFCLEIRITGKNASYNS